MRRFILLTLILQAAGFQTGMGADPPATAPDPASSANAAKADPAQRLSAATRRLLASVKTSSYAHRTAIDEEAGSFVTDCSGLLTWLLRQELPRHLAAIPNRRGRGHPLAADFQEAFAAGVPGWRRVERVQDVRPGDVLVWRLLNPQPGGSTGHVVIIDGEAVPEGADVYALTVIDSTSAPHDDDTRTDADGVGRGTIHLRVNGEGAPTAVKGSARSAFRKHAFVIARPIE